jgi:drug/metabolite transporter (DMT)-like permease
MSAETALSREVVPTPNAIAFANHTGHHQDRRLSVVRDYLRLHFIVFLWGFTAILGKLITLPAVEMVFWRTSIAAAAIATIWAVFHRNQRLAPRPAIELTLSGAIIAGHWICFFASAKIASASIALAGISLTPLLTSFFVPLINGGRVKRREVILGIIAIIGLCLIAGFEFKQLGGLALGIAAAFLGAIFTILIARYTTRHPPLAISFCQVFGAALACLAFFPIYARMPILNPDGVIHWFGPWQDLGWLLLLALVCTVYPYVVMVELLRRVTPFTMNLAVNMEPIYGIILALIIFRDEEQMTRGFYVGTLLILSSVIAQPLLDRMAHKRIPRDKAEARMQVSS